MDAGFLDGAAKFEIYNPKRPVGVLQVVKYVQTRPGGSYTATLDYSSASRWILYVQQLSV